MLAECADGWPAVVAKGNVTYAAAWLDPALQLAWLEQLTREAGLQPQRLPDGVRTRQLGDATFVFNYSDAAYSAPIPTGKSVVIGDATVPAQGGVLAYR